MFQIKVVHLYKLNKNVSLCFSRKTNPLAENCCRKLTQMYIYIHCFHANFLQRFSAKGLVFREKHKNTFLFNLKR